MIGKTVVCVWALLLSGALPGTSQLSAAVQAETDKPALSEKVIHDPVEYNAYVSALNILDPTQKATAMEAFVAGYPDSAVRGDAMEQALAAWQQAGNQAKMEEVARKTLQLDPSSVRALAIIVSLTRTELTQGRGDTKPASLRTLAERGLRELNEWEKAENLAQGDFEKLQSQMKVIFYGGAGFGALQGKDFPAARDYYTKALEIEPDDLVNTYQLSIADLEMTNIDVRGFWYVGRAIHLVEKQRNTQAAASGMANYGKAKYGKYHGSLEGWNEILNRTASRATPPRDFTVRPAPQRDAQSASQLGGTPASLTSSSSPGNAHGVPASVLSSSSSGAAAAAPATVVSPREVQRRGKPASVLSSSSAGTTAQGAPATLLSSDSSGTAHGVPASVLSFNSSGTGHQVPASITSAVGTPSADLASGHKRLVRFGKPHHPPQPLVPIPIFLPAYR